MGLAFLSLSYFMWALENCIIFFFTATLINQANKNFETMSHPEVKTQPVTKTREGTFCLISARRQGHLALEIKAGVCVCACVCVPLQTDAVHLPRPPWAGQAFLIHIPQIIEGRAEASLDPPGQTLVNSTGRSGGTLGGNQHLHLPELCACSQGARTVLCVNDLRPANRPSWSLRWVMSTLYPPTHPPTPPLSPLCLRGADVRERGAREGGGQGRAIDTRAIVSQRPPFRVI